MWDFGDRVWVEIRRGDFGILGVGDGMGILGRR